VVNYHVSTDWNYEEWFQLEASANYYQYTLTDFSSPWHRPEWEISLHNKFQPDNKWLIHVNANVMGGIPVINLESDKTDTLGAIADLQAKVDYSISDRLSVFAVGNNLLNQSYQRFWNYPVRGIQGIGGVSFKF
jgi:outer membrane cobalamin receptor